MKKLVFIILTLFVLPLFAAPSPRAPAPAAPQVVTTVSADARIADEDLVGFEKGCILGADKSVPTDSTAKYCGCMKARVAQTVTRDEYRGYNEKVFASGKKDTIPYTNEAFKNVEKKITDSVTACSALLEVPNKNIE
jgi:hypothetical protein